MGDMADQMFDLALSQEIEADCEREWCNNNGYWRTRDGRIIKISKMEDNHLTNTVRMLERNRQKSHWPAVIAEFKRRKLDEQNN